MSSSSEEYYDVIPLRDPKTQLLDGGKNVIPVLNTHGAAIALLSKQSEICPLISNGDIKMRFFASGRNGSVAEVTFEGMGTKKYVVKAAKILKEALVLKADYNMQALAKWLYENYGIIPRTFIELNGGDVNRVFRAGQSVIFPSFATECKLLSPLRVYSTINPSQIVQYPTNSYLCGNNAYSEYIISLLAGEIYRSGASINFLDTFNFATCAEYPPPAPVLSAFKKLASKRGTQLESYDKIGAQYTFMEKIDGTLNSILQAIDPLYIPGLVIQLLHAIATYQEQHRIVHGDLHMENVFFVKIEKDTTFQGNLLSAADYFSYAIGDTTLYLPAETTPYIIKIGDWGLSVKYTDPIVGDLHTIRTGYDEMNGNGPILPNTYNPLYDMMYSLWTFNRENPNAFILQIFQYLTTDYSKTYKFFNNRYRPILRYLVTPPLAGKSPKTVLKEPSIMSPFLVKPASDKVVIELGRTF